VSNQADLHRNRLIAVTCHPSGFQRAGLLPKLHVGENRL
jgi:hypothetical protein